MLARLIFTLLIGALVTAAIGAHFQTIKIVDLRHGCVDANGNPARYTHEIPRH